MLKELEENIFYSWSKQRDRERAGRERSGVNGSNGSKEERNNMSCGKRGVGWRSGVNQQHWINRFISRMCSIYPSDSFHSCTKKSGIYRDKTVADKLMYIHNDVTQNYHLCILKLVFETFEHST